MTADDPVQLLTDRRAHLVTVKRGLQSKLENIDRFIEATDLIIQSYSEFPGDYLATGLESSKVSEVKTEAKFTPFELGANSDPEPEFESFNGLTVQDIAHCTDVNEALEAMARLKEGDLRYRDAAKVLMKAGLMEVKSVDSAGASIQSRLRGKKEWEFLGDGLFRFLPAIDGEAARSQESPELAHPSADTVP